MSLRLQDSVSKYKLKIKDGDKEVDEEIEVDTKKETETVRVSKENSGNAGEVDVIHDFKKVKSNRQGMTAANLLRMGPAFLNDCRGTSKETAAALIIY